MNCKRIEKNLLPFEMNELPEDQRREVENHLKICPDCCRLLEEFSQLWDIVEHREKIQPSPCFWAKLKHRITESEEEGKPAFGWVGGLIRRMRPAIAVAVLLICIFAGYSLGNFPQSANGQTAYQTDQRTFALQQFLDKYNLQPLIDSPSGSMEATYLNVISGE
jgi:hypothetical protein